MKIKTSILTCEFVGRVSACCPVYLQQQQQQNNTSKVGTASGGDTNRPQMQVPEGFITLWSPSEAY